MSWINLKDQNEDIKRIQEEHFVEIEQKGEDLGGGIYLWRAVLLNGTSVNFYATVATIDATFGVVGLSLGEVL